MLTVRELGEGELTRFFAYLDDHLSDNGKDGTALFQPLPRADSRLHEDKKAVFEKGLATPLGQPCWRRVWIAVDDGGDIAGHIDLRARPEPAASHRAQLGMGVHRAFRQRGLGLQLVEVAVAWALAETALAWIDLEVLSGNAPARALYARAGFVKVGELPDMFRINGEALAFTYMSRPLRIA
ncbi:MAG: GNAT family N-acetyltransferase [Pseudomonadota bacterium]